MYCTGPFIQFVVHDMPTIEKKCLIVCLDSLQKEACLARPAGGAVDLSWQLVSPVTPDRGVTAGKKREQLVDNVFVFFYCKIENIIHDLCYRIIVITLSCKLLVFRMKDLTWC